MLLLRLLDAVAVLVCHSLMMRMVLEKRRRRDDVEDRISADLLKLSDCARQRKGRLHLGRGASSGLCDDHCIAKRLTSEADGPQRLLYIVKLLFLEVLFLL